MSSVTLAPFSDLVGIFRVEGTPFLAQQSNDQTLVIGIWDDEAKKITDVPEDQLLDVWILGLSLAP